MIIKHAEITGGREMAAVLRALPDALAKNALNATARAGALQLQRTAYAYLALAMKSRSPREDDVIIKKRRGAKGENVQAVYDVGPTTRKPWLRWLHDGTKPHVISAEIRHGTRRGALDTEIAPVWIENGQAMTLRRRGRKVRAVAMRAASVLVLADKIAGKFFGTSVQHPGQVGIPWLKQAQFVSVEAVMKAMAEKMRPALAKQVKRLVSQKYRGQQLRRIFS